MNDLNPPPLQPATRPVGIRLGLVAQMNDHTRSPSPHAAALALRSVFGWSLRRQVCVTRAKTCEGCPVRTVCIYGRIFDPLPPRHPLHPSFTTGIPGYAIAGLTASGATTAAIDLDFRLLAPREADVATVERALVRAVDGNTHFFGGGFRARIDGVRPLEPIVLPREDEWTQIPHGETTPSQARFRMHCQSPLAIKQDNRDLLSGAAITGETLWRLAWRRLTQFAQLVDADPLPDPTPWREAAARLAVDARALRPHRLERTSQTQAGRTHPVTGLLGTIIVHGSAGDVQLLHRLLAAAAPLQIGKDTVFGCGRIELDPIET